MSITVVYNAGQGHDQQPTEHVLTFTVELHNGNRNMHTTRGTHVGSIGRRIPLRNFTDIEPQLLSPKASDQVWTHAFAIRSNSIVTGVWLHNLGTTRCIGVQPQFTPHRSLPYAYPAPLRGVATGNYDYIGNALGKGADWASRQFKDDETLAIAVIVQTGRLYLAWLRDGNGAKLVATGPRAFL